MISGNGYIYGNGEIRPTFWSSVTHNLTVYNGSNGYTVPVGTDDYYENSLIEVYAYPDSGYRVSEWILDSVNVGNGSKYTVFMGTDHALTCNFEVSPFEVYVLTSSPYNSVTIDGVEYWHGNIAYLFAGTYSLVANTPFDIFYYWDYTDGVTVGGTYDNPTTINVSGNGSITMYSTT